MLLEPMVITLGYAAIPLHRELAASSLGGKSHRDSHLSSRSSTLLRHQAGIGQGDQFFVKFPQITSHPRRQSFESLEVASERNGTLLEC